MKNQGENFFPKSNGFPSKLSKVLSTKSKKAYVWMSVVECIGELFEPLRFSKPRDDISLWHSNDMTHCHFFTLDIVSKKFYSHRQIAKFLRNFISTTFFPPASSLQLEVPKTSSSQQKERKRKCKKIYLFSTFFYFSSIIHFLKNYLQSFSLTIIRVRELAKNVLRSMQKKTQNFVNEKKKTEKIVSPQKSQKGR